MTIFPPTQVPDDSLFLPPSTLIVVGAILGDPFVNYLGISI